MDITIGQIFGWVQHNWIQAIVWLIAADNILITACAAAGWNKMETFLQAFGRFLGAVLAGRAKIGTTMAPQAPKQAGSASMRLIFMVCCIGGLVGCALAGGTNVRVQGTDIKSAYASGSGTINVNSRHCWSVFGGKCVPVGYDSVLNNDTTNEYIGGSNVNPGSAINSTK